MIRFRQLPLFRLLVSFGILTAGAMAAPKPVPASFAGTYTASGFSGKSGDDGSVNRGYEGKVRISSTGVVSGKILRTETKYLTGGATEETTKRVLVSGNITRVKATTHGGYKVLVATTKIKLADGLAGTLTVYFPYTVATAGKSGGGATGGRGYTGNMMFQQNP